MAPEPAHCCIKTHHTFITLMNDCQLYSTVNTRTCYILTAFVYTFSANHKLGRFPRRHLWSSQEQFFGLHFLQITQSAVTNHVSQKYKHYYRYPHVSSRTKQVYLLFPVMYNQFICCTASQLSTCFRCIRHTAHKRHSIMCSIN